ncbi:hypothetical protein [Paraburkholderia unamae]|uniref:Uncharacterized protein n=1 Tax=Paraburkholderia unamae TaxID=219649 RepID=A0ABX5KLA1_9BURK|nr:hypothetical protein [Paraburkholderia unamae]PVX77208.1 hypothetical protein C7402_115267 [Paraburkholderia unamae]
MAQHHSTRSMVERLTGLLGTKDLTDWETGFVESMQRRLANNSLTTITEAQATALETIFNKHFV